MYLLSTFAKHFWYAFLVSISTDIVCIYMEEKRDAKLMRCKPLCVYLALIALTTHKWGASEPRGRSKRHRCAPVLPRSHLSARNVRARAVAHRAEQQANEQQTVPLCARTSVSHLSVGTPKLGRHTSDQAKRHQTVHARTPTPPPFGGGRPSYKSACTVGQGQTHDASEGVGDATDVGGDRGGSCKTKIGADMETLAIQSLRGVVQ